MEVAVPNNLEGTRLQKEELDGKQNYRGKSWVMGKPWSLHLVTVLRWNVGGGSSHSKRSTAGCYMLNQHPHLSAVWVSPISVQFSFLPRDGRFLPGMRSPLRSSTLEEQGFFPFFSTFSSPCPHFLLRDTFPGDNLSGAAYQQWAAGVKSGWCQGQTGAGVWVAPFLSATPFSHWSKPTLI